MQEERVRQPLPVASTIAAIRSVCTVASMLREEDLEEVISEVSRTETLMPFTDPTGFMAISDQLPGMGRIARALLVFRRELRKETGR